jgi:hypothetical protein
MNGSAGRFPDGRDTDSNCADFYAPSVSNLADRSAAGATNIKVSTVANFEVGQTVVIDNGDATESAVIAKVGTPGATTIAVAAEAGSTTIIVANAQHFTTGQAIALDDGAGYEEAVVVSVSHWRNRIVVKAPLKFAHTAGVKLSGSGITLSNGLKYAHPSGAQITSDLPTPGAPNQYPRSHRQM